MPKFFVALAHLGDHVFCLKATSNAEIYKSNPSKLAGVVLFPAGTIACFPVDTVVQPDNQFPVPHSDIIEQHARGTFKIEAQCPASFHADLVAAVLASDTLEPRQEKRLYGLLGL